MNRFQKLAWTSVAATAALISLGALVRATDSGLACPDWPTCFGRWVPPLRAQTLIEYSHRLFASMLGLLVLAVAVAAWLKQRSKPSVFWPSLLALVTVGIQGWIGRQVVLGDLPRNLVALHLFTSLTVLGLLTFAATAAGLPKGGRLDKTAVHAIAAAAGSMVTLMIGAFVSQYGAALAFPDWPLMNGTLAPPRSDLPLLHWVHRIAAGVLGIVLAWLAFRVSRRRPKDKALTALAHGALGLWFVQALIGGFNVLTRLADWAVVLHVLFAALLWVALIVLSLVAYRRAVQPAPVATEESQAGRTSPPPAPAVYRGIGAAGGGKSDALLSERIKAYVALTKPRIIELLLITTVPAMILAARGWPSPWLILATLVGGSLSAGSANSINCYLDRDIDEKMERTAARPLPRHAVEPAEALRFGIVLGVAGFVWLSLAVNLAAAALSVAAILFYVFVYTMLMKRSTPSNIVIGGAAGAAPALIGWAAVTGGLARPAWILFAIIFYWTPPHFWALALRYCDQYRAADIPMLPVVRGVPETTRQMLVYSVILAAVSLFLLPMAGLGWVYLGACLLLNGAFIAYALHLRAAPDEKRAMRLFHFSISYLVLLFAAVAVDALLNRPVPAGVYRWSLASAAVVYLLSQAALLASVMGSGRFTSPGVSDGNQALGPSQV